MFFSLILPCYNVEKYVARCAQSILSQDFADYEIILVDDGATDATPCICDELAAGDERIRVIHKENGGLSSARNAGLEAARGEYVWFVDSDDWIAPGALSKLHDACTDGVPEIVKFAHERAAGVTTPVYVCIPAGWHEGSEAVEKLQREAYTRPGKYVLSAWSHLYRRDFLLQHELRFVSERIVCSEDYLFNLIALAKARLIRVLDEILYTYELRPGSLTQRYKPDLTQRYRELRRLLLEAGCDAALTNRFFVWHLLAGTCIPHMYRHAPEPRQAVKDILRVSELREAIRDSDKRGIILRKHIQLAAMYMGSEPLFYYLHVAKPARRRSQG